MNKLFALLSLLLCLACSNQVEFKRIDAEFKHRYNLTDAPGAAIIIAKGDSILYEQYAGVADCLSGQAIDSLTRFNIASISKQLTSVSILSLQNEGRLNIDDRILKYLQNVDSIVFKDVKLKHLMSHSSGIPDSRPRNDREWMLKATDEESILYLDSVQSLHFTPGTAYEYINPTFQILYSIIQQKSGHSFVDFQQENIFDKAGMCNSFYFDCNAHHDNVAHGYVCEGAEESDDRDTSKPTIFSDKPIIDSSGKKWHEYDYGEETFFATKADGGCYSTARDLLKWNIALNSGKIIPQNLLDSAYSKFTVVSGSDFCNYQNRPNTFYGFGFFIDSTPGFPTKIYHTGDNGGFQAYLAYYLEQKISIIILENRNDYDRWDFVKLIDAELREKGLI